MMQLNVSNYFHVGLFNVLIEQLKTSTPLRFKLGRQRQYMDILNADSKVPNTNSGSTNRIALPISMETTDKDPCRVKVYESTGLAYVVRRNVKKPLNQLAGSFINGGQVIGLTLILTGIAGICIWLLDRRRNPTDFPAPFIRGSWQGFWWAFVTMTTVGYGDLAPKSVPARMFSVLWMLLGLVAFSVLTANFTSSLAREIETDLNLFNKKIGVFKGSIERKAAIDVGGKFLEYTDLTKGMVNALKQNHIEGLLIDKHVVVSDTTIIEDDETIEIGKMIDFRHYLGMRLIMPKPEMCIAVKDCIEDFVKTSPFKFTLLEVLSNSTISKDDVVQAGSLFEDYEFFVILIALFGVMTVIGVIWEYFYYNPKLIKQSHIDSEDEGTEMAERNILKYVITNMEVQNLCEGCCDTIEAIYEREGQERHERLKSCTKGEHSNRISPTINISSVFPSSNISFLKGKNKAK
ncbi:hypothetical protein QZH41_015160 [Actinostola sp. cb2023]|nr:hypothetical protein QZH41_015160 [Actinostola sp. cb2023]